MCTQCHYIIYFYSTYIVSVSVYANQWSSPKKYPLYYIYIYLSVIIYQCCFISMEFVFNYLYDYIEIMLRNSPNTVLLVNSPSILGIFSLIIKSFKLQFLKFLNTTHTIFSNSFFFCTIKECSVVIQTWEPPPTLLKII